MTMTSVLPDSLDDLDFDSPRLCEVVDEGVWTCSRPAAWLTVCPVCTANDAKCCRGHRDGQNIIFTCMRCGYRGQPSTWKWCRL